MSQQLPPAQPTPPRSNRSQILLLLFGGVLPVLAFALVEEHYGVLWGTIAGMAFGFGEIVYEKLRLGKVSGLTWFSNALILGLGAISLISQEGVWFKLQPAVLLASFGAILLGSSILKRPLMVAMAQKQRPDLPIEALGHLRKFNFRLAWLFFGLAAIGVHAALTWSVEAWAFFKSVGVVLLMVAYFAVEFGVQRWRLHKLKNKSHGDESR